MTAAPTERLGLSGQGGSWRGGHNDALAALQIVHTLGVE